MSSADGESGAAAGGFSRSPTPTIAAFTLSIAAICIGLLTQSDLGLADASVERVSRSSEHLLPEALLAIRALFALIIVHALVSRMREPPTIVTPLRNPFSRTPPATIKMHKWVIFSTFTVQSWTLQLVYFVGTSLLGASNLLGIAPTGFIATFLSAFLWVAFEVSFTASMLVSATTTYVLIPKTLRSGQVPINFFRWSQQAMHNLNVVFMGKHN